MNNLILGWKVNQDLEPIFWLELKGEVGKYDADRDLVAVPAIELACNMAIVAQSGSGKSYFLGRLIEEIVLKTKARCLILDPNADFKRINTIKSKAIWENATLNFEGSDLHVLPPEDSFQEFTQNWPVSQIRIRSAAFQEFENSTIHSLKLWWPWISIDFLTENLDAYHQAELRLIHEFVIAIAYRVWWKYWIEENRSNLGNIIEISENIYRKAIVIWQKTEPLDASSFSELIQRELDTKLNQPAWYREEITKKLKKIRDEHIAVAVEMPFETEQITIEELTEKMNFGLQGIRPFSTESIDYYFAQARMFKHFISSTPPSSTDFSRRVEVVDLSSIGSKSNKLLTVNTIVEGEWRHASNIWSKALMEAQDRDTRVPTFIVIDEAHNLIPAEPEGLAEIATRNQFRRIVAEGRKYGLFLIVVSQRPDKIDPMVLSACENVALMRFNSKDLLDKIKKSVGLENIPEEISDKTLVPGMVGRALLIGRWVNQSPTWIQVGARRTMEGGRNLRSQYWASSFSQNNANS